MICLDNGDLIEGDADNASEVDCTIHGLVGDTFTQLDARQLPNAKGTLYTAGAAVSVVSVIMVNTGAAAQSVNLYLHNGSSSFRLIPKDLELGIGYSMHYDGQRCYVLDGEGNILSTNETSHTDVLIDGEFGSAGLMKTDGSGGYSIVSDTLHAQGTDTALGTMVEDINMNDLYQVVNLQAPAASGEAIRQTASITEVALESIIASTSLAEILTWSTL